MSDTGPSNRSASSLYLSNWKDVVAIWESNKLTQTDVLSRGPGIAELHYLGGRGSTWSINNVAGYCGVFRDETRSEKYTEISRFGSEAWFETDAGSAGILRSGYSSYAGSAVQPKCLLERRHSAVPEQQFIVVQYQLTNSSTQATVINLLDYLRLNNVAAQDPAMPVHAWRDEGRNALLADMSASGQFFVVLGAFQSMDGFQVGDEDSTTPGDPAGPALLGFDGDGTLANNANVQAGNVSLAFNKRISLGPGETKTISMYLAIGLDLPTVLAAADAARNQTAPFWFSQTATQWTQWLSNGGKARRVNFADHGLNRLFDASVIAIKNMQNPMLGTIVASTNPFAYGYKNWVRDGSIVAIALDAAGHYAEADKYWRWMASVQDADGSWKTTYSFWTGAYLSFVEPEYDSIGAFLYGVYRHHRATGDSNFLNDLWPAAKRAADWILLNIAPQNGLGAADFSIWEEPERGLQHNSFTQAWYVTGLYSAQCMAELRGDTNLTDWYAGGPASIMTSLQRPSSWQPPGSWDLTGYYGRGVNADNTPAGLQDSSSNLLIALGVIDARSGRARSHIGTLLAALTKNSYGLARYRGDIYYNTSQWDPAGDEVGGIEPAWPQMSMWVAIYESLVNRGAALRRMQWFASTAGVGYMPQGEAVSNLTQLSVLSSMSEPLTASSYILAALCYSGKFDLRILPPIYNAGTYKAVKVAPGANNGDLWSNVPYFVGNLIAHPQEGPTAINRVYVCNDDANIYVRVDNASGALAAYRAVPVFAIRIYGQDFAHGAATMPSGLDGQPISRAVSFVVERRSDDDVFRRFSVAGNAWVPQSPIQNVMIPQWNPASGSIQAAIPIDAFCSETVAIGNAWATLAVTIAHIGSPPDGWIDGNKILIHYRLSGADQPWLYGNIEQ